MSLLVALLMVLAAQAQTSLEPPLHRAADRGDIASLQELLDQGVDVDTRSEGIGTALHRVVGSWRLETDKKLAIIDFLIGHGADVNARNESGFTPLFLASSDDLVVALHLIDLGADVNARNKSGSMPLAFILSRSHPNDLAFSHLLGKAVALGLDINAADLAGTTALHIAASRTPRLIDELIDANADPNIADGRGQTPLHFLSMHNEETIPGVREAIESLIAAGADINAVDKLRNTPLSRATTANTRILLAHSAKPDFPDSVPPLNVAAYRGDDETVRLLLAAGADPRRSWQGDNAIDRAYEGLRRYGGGHQRAESNERGRSYLHIIEQLKAVGGASVGDRIVQFVGLHPSQWRNFKQYSMLVGIVFSSAIFLLVLALFASFSKRAKNQRWGRALAHASWYSLVGTGLILAAGIFLISEAQEAGFFVFVLVEFVAWTATILQLIFWYSFFGRRAARQAS